MTDDRVHHVRGGAQAEDAADVGWEPDDWAPVLRARRRRDLLVLVALVLGTVTSLVVRLVLRDKPMAVETWFWLAAVLVYVAVTVHAHGTSAGRSEWLEETRRDVRVDHALRHHVSIGAADRTLVTERAEKTDSRAVAHFAGWPLLGMVVLAGIESTDGLSRIEEVTAGLVVALLCAILVLSARRRVRRARRWLADPLPRDDQQVSWT